MQNKTLRVTIYSSVIGLSIILLSASFFSKLDVKPKTGEISIIIKVPSILEFVQDTSVIKYLKKKGVYGVAISPALTTDEQNIRDVTIASGAEILRIFRMEGIANIWMWEQIKDKPIKENAVYIFTNQFLLHKNILTSLESKFGTNTVRPYNDNEHNFGGGIAGNYIIEANLPKEELISFISGFDKTIYNTLKLYGLIPVYEISNPYQLKNLPYHISDIIPMTNEAASAAFSEKNIEKVYLSKNTINPGWSKTIQLYNNANENITNGGAIITDITDADSIITELKLKGFTLGEHSIEVIKTNNNYLSGVNNALFKQIISFLSIVTLSILLYLTLNRAEKTEIFKMEKYLQAISLSLLFLLAAFNNQPSILQIQNFRNISIISTAVVIILNGIYKKSNPVIIGTALFILLLPEKINIYVLWGILIFSIITIYVKQLLFRQTFIILAFSSFASIIFCYSEIKILIILSVILGAGYIFLKYVIENKELEIWDTEQHNKTGRKK